MHLPQPLFAAVGDWIGFIVMALAVLGWLGNLIGNQKQQPPAPRAPQPPPRPRDKRIQNEIDVFLQEVTGKKKPPEEVPIEIVPEQQRRPRPPVRPAANEPRRAAARPAAAQRAPAEARPASASGAPAAQRGRGARDLGSGVASHVQTYMAEHPGELAQHRLQPTLGKGLLDESDAEAAEKAGSAVAQQIAAMIREPGGAQKAILINEILSRPKSLRGR
jgi:hypothetical protein